MFENIPFSYPGILHIAINYLKGGDFMNNELEPTSVTGLNNTSFPESRGSGTETTDKLSTVATAANAAFSVPTAIEIAKVQRLDLVTLNSISEMDAT